MHDSIWRHYVQRYFTDPVSVARVISVVSSETALVSMVHSRAPVFIPVDKGH